METRFLEIQEQVINRRRKLNMMHWIRVSLTASMSVTFLNLVLVYLGATEMSQPLWVLFAINIGAIFVGWLIGKSKSVSISDDLLRVDQVFRLGEKLTTIHSLRERRTSPVFLEALYRKVESLRINPRNALLLSDRDQKGWIALGGLFFASLLIALLWGSGLNPAASLWGPGSPMGQTPHENSLLINQDQAKELESLMNQDSTARESDSASSGEEGKNCPEGASASGSAPRTGRNDIFIEDECSSENESQSLNDLFNNNEQSNPRPNSLSQELAQLMAQLLHGQISPEDARAELQQLASQLPPGAMQDMLNELSETEDLNELLERMQDAFDEAMAQEEQGNNELADNNENSGQGSNGSTEGGSGSEFGSDFLDANAPSPSSQGGSGNSSSNNTIGDPANGSSSGEQSGEPPNGSGGEAGEGEEGGEEGGGEGEGDGSGEGESTAENSGEGASSGQSSQTTPDSGGNGVGQAPGDGRQSTEQVERVEGDKSVYIRSDQLPADAEILQKLMTLGLPVDLEGEQTTGTTEIRLNVERVEALMEMRDLPPQLKALVRTYFLAITGERDE